MNPQEPCPRIEALSALTDGELIESERLAVQAHVDGCAICAPVLAEFRQLRTGLAALTARVPDFDVAPDVDRRIAAASAPGTRASVRAARPPHPRWWQVAVLAPGGAMAVATGLWLGAALMPAALQPARATAVQMVPFSTLPPGALCPAPQACGGAR
jgi:anti-sigma factor RsiW